MHQSRRQLAQLAIAKALEIRKQAGCDLKSAVSVVGLCERLGVAVRFSDIPSMEGMYIPDARPQPTILVSALRPAGRRSLTCGHELGHHVFGHGEQWDELVEQRTESRRFEPNEFQADLFSASLHMPKLAVSYAFSQRDIDAHSCPPESIYAVAGWFGVGYATLITHMHRTLNLIEEPRARELLQRQPKDIRARLLGADCPQNLVVADVHWKDRAIDVEVGDSIILPVETASEGDCIAITQHASDRTIVQAQYPGIGRVVQEQLDWAAYVRVMRKNYVGRAPFRFDEELDDVK